MARKRSLTKKQKLFCEEFLIDLNATRAYREVYNCKQTTAEVNACKLLSNAKVGQYIKTRLDKRFEQAGIDQQRVIDRLVELVDRCMERKPVMIRQGNKVVQKKSTRTDPETGDEYEVGVRTFDSAGANSALEKLAKYFKLYSDAPKVDVVVNNITEKDEKLVDKYLEDK